MKRKFCLGSVLLPLIGLFGFLPFPLHAQNSPPPQPEERQPPDPEFNDTDFGTIAAFSQTITSTTGVAMSPLLGMGVLGAWKYYKSDEAYRDRLPWYSNPWVWGVCFGIFLLLKSKDTLGVWIPEVAKKPITVLDDVADKASALIVALAVIPAAVWDQLENYAPQPASEAQVAMIPYLLPVLLSFGSIAIFAVVWVAFNSLSSIKILSPFSLLNSAISFAKGAVIAGFAALAALNPWVGLALSLLIILVCALLFGWAFRWNVFGTLFAKDFLTGAFDKPLEAGEDLKGFSSGNFPGIKPRTYGRVRREGNELVFSWKPWLILPSRKSRINLEGVETGCRKGIFLPSVTLSQGESDRHRSIIDFRLRYRSQSEEINARLGLDGVRPGLVASGARAGWTWFREQVKRGGSSFAKNIQSRESAAG